MKTDNRSLLILSLKRKIEELESVQQILVNTNCELMKKPSKKYSSWWLCFNWDKNGEPVDAVFRIADCPEGALCGQDEELTNDELRDCCLPIPDKSEFKDI